MICRVLSGTVGGKTIRASARGFAGNGLPSGRKILRRKLIGQKIVDWYPEDIERKDPYMLNLEAER